MSNLDQYNIPGLDSDNGEKKENENNNGKMIMETRTEMVLKNQIHRMHSFL